MTVGREHHQRGLECPVGARLDVPFRKTGDLPGHIMLCPYRKRVISLGTSCCAPTENGSSPFVIPDPATRHSQPPTRHSHFRGNGGNTTREELRSRVTGVCDLDCFNIYGPPRQSPSQPWIAPPRRLISACASHRLPYLGSLSSIPCAAVSRHDLSGAGIFCFFFPHSQ